MKHSNFQLFAFNPLTRKWEPVFPESEVNLDKCVPMFYSERVRRYVTIPGATLTSELYAQWLKQ